MRANYQEFKEHFAIFFSPELPDSVKIDELAKLDDLDLAQEWGLIFEALEEELARYNNVLASQYPTSEVSSSTAVTYKKRDVRIAKKCVADLEADYLYLKRLHLAYLNKLKEKEPFYLPNEKIPLIKFLRTKASRRFKKPAYDLKKAIKGTGINVTPAYLAEKNDPEHHHVPDVTFYRYWSKSSKNAYQDFFTYAKRKRSSLGQAPELIKYDSNDNQRYRVYTKRGKIVNADKTAVNGRYIYVMNLKGELFLDKTADPQRNHASLCAGEKVLCAGEISIVKGKITAFNNISDCYEPGPFSLNKAIQHLDKKGVIDKGLFINYRFPPSPSSLNSQSLKPISSKRSHECFTKKEFNAHVKRLENDEGLNILQCVRDINHYLTKRATETRRSALLIRLFGFSGKDYYERLESWERVLQAWQTNGDNPETIITALKNIIDEFNGKSKFKMSNRYIKHLTKLRAAIQASIQNRENISPQDELTNRSFLKREVDKTLTVHESLNNITKAYKKRNFANLPHLFSDYRLKVQAQKGFLTTAQIKKHERINLKSR